MKLKHFYQSFYPKTYLIEFSCGENHQNLSSHTSHHHARLPWIGFGGFLFFLIHSSLADDRAGGDFHQKSINLWLCWSRHLCTTIWTNLLWTLNITVKHHNLKRATDMNNNACSPKKYFHLFTVIIHMKHKMQSIFLIPLIKYVLDSSNSLRPESWVSGFQVSSLPPGDNLGGSCHH